MLIFLTSTALAGSGPWSLSKGDHALFFGFEAQRFTTLHPVVGGVPEEADTGGRIYSTTGKLSATFGLIDRVEVEATVPYHRVELAETGGGACADFPLAACETTQGIGLIDLRTKWQFVDELGGAPFSWSIGGRMRLGAHTQETRERITNIGEGTTDFGVYSALGRTGRLGRGFYNGHVEVGYLYRPTNLVEPKAPHDELWADAAIHVAPQQSVCVGPVMSWFWRPGGVDFDTVDLESADRFASLTAANTRLGGEIVLRDPNLGVSLVATILTTVYARNNPKDTWVVSLGIGAHNPLRR